MIRKQSRGVALVFFLMVLGLMLGFFMLIANTGMLVYQKMKLQTAVDLASYAGASVQASYMGGNGSGKDSVRAVNFEIFQRYQKLLGDLKNIKPAPWPMMIPGGVPGKFVCEALCNSANMMMAAQVESAYKSAARDMEKTRARMSRILDELPQAAQKAAEATIEMNIPEISLDNSSALAAMTSGTLNDVNKVIQSNKSTAQNQKRKNAVLSFSSAKGLYLANIVAAVPHTFPFFGLVGNGCFPMMESDPSANGQPNMWYCTVNGSGYPGGKKGFQAATLAYARSFVPDPRVNGNVGTIATISDSGVNAIRLHFVENDHKPNPFFMSAVEWYPDSGSYMNLENSLGAKGSLFPKQTKLAAVSVAEPFGGSLLLNDGRPYGVRLQSIRKVLLDPRMYLVQKDFPGLYDYMESLGSRDKAGKAREKPEDIIRKFLH